MNSSSKRLGMDAGFGTNGLSRRSVLAGGLRGALLSSVPASMLLGLLAPQAKAADAMPADVELRGHVLWDVVVVGAGGAGLAAAVAAKEAGAEKVLVIEKSALAGGHALVSSGSVNAYDPVGQTRMGRSDTKEAYWKDTYQGGGSKADPDLVTALVNGSEFLIPWLEGMGVVFDPMLFEAYNGLYPRAHRTMMHRSGFVYVERLMIAARRLGVQFYFRMRAQKLIRAEGVDGQSRVAGIWATDSRGITVPIAAKTVILATGGFGASVALRERWEPKLASQFSTTYSFGLPEEDPATGDGIAIAEEAGAALREMDAVMAIPFWGGRVLDYPGAEIFLTRAGVRFTDETLSWQQVLDHLLVTGTNEFWVVTDAKSRKGATFAGKVQQGMVRSADSLEALAEAMGVSVARIKSTFERYNDAAQKGYDVDFGRMRFTQTISTPPFYFGRERFDIHYTCGGIAITPEAEVKLQKGGILPGLYAAGETTGGVHGSFRIGGNGLTDAFVFGRIAGTSAAKFALSF